MELFVSSTSDVLGRVEQRKTAVRQGTREGLEGDSSLSILLECLTDLAFHLVEAEDIATSFLSSEESLQNKREFVDNVQKCFHCYAGVMRWLFAPRDGKSCYDLYNKNSCDTEEPDWLDLIGKWLLILVKPSREDGRFARNLLKLLQSQLQVLQAAGQSFQQNQSFQRGFPALLRLYDLLVQLCMEPLVRENPSLTRLLLGCCQDLRWKVDIPCLISVLYSHSLSGDEALLQKNIQVLLGAETGLLDTLGEELKQLILLCQKSKSLPFVSRVAGIVGTVFQSSEISKVVLTGLIEKFDSWAHFCHFCHPHMSSYLLKQFARAQQMCAATNSHSAVSWMLRESWNGDSTSMLWFFKFISRLIDLSNQTKPTPVLETTCWKNIIEALANSGFVVKGKPNRALLSTAKKVLVVLRKTASPNIAEYSSCLDVLFYFGCRLIAVPLSYKFSEELGMDVKSVMTEALDVEECLGGASFRFLWTVATVNERVLSPRMKDCRGELNTRLSLDRYIKVSTKCESWPPLGSTIAHVGIEAVRWSGFVQDNTPWDPEYKSILHALSCRTFEDCDSCHAIFQATTSSMLDRVALVVLLLRGRLPASEDVTNILSRGGFTLLTDITK